MNGIIIVGCCTLMAIHIYEYSCIPEKESCYKSLVDFFKKNYNPDFAKNITKYEYEYRMDGGGKIYYIPVIKVSN